jgi:hypothetical protein
MLGLIESDFAAAGEWNPCDGTPPRFLDLGAVNAFFLKYGNFGIEVVAEEVEFLALAFFGWMDCGFGGRQCEDEPSMAGVH